MDRGRVLVLANRRYPLHCQLLHGYRRKKKYCPFDDPDDFAYVIQVKENVPDLLRRAQGRLPVKPRPTGGQRRGSHCSGSPCFAGPSAGTRLGHALPSAAAASDATGLVAALVS